MIYIFLKLLFMKNITIYFLFFRSTRRLSNCFSFKDRLPSSLLSGLVYKFKCCDCNVTYYGKTKLHFKVRISEHLGVSPLTEKRGF